MIATERAPWLSLWVRVTAPLSFADDHKTAAKLLGFAATEAGSALDMLKAAELERDPHLRRLFFLHALDEARHATMFQHAARVLSPSRDVRLSRYALIHARRQNLYQTLGRLGFVAFIARAETKGQQHFATLARRFADQPQLHELFSVIEREERFHVRYAFRTLRRWADGGQQRAVRRALRRVRLQDLLGAWRRSGRRLGDRVASVTLALVWALTVPWFAIAARLFERPQTGWRTSSSSSTDLRSLRDQA